MNAESEYFRFSASPCKEDAGAVLFFAVPKGIGEKSQLLSLLADGLSFPSYFGGNWDAFAECIRDLSWIPAGKVVLAHEDVPLADDQGGRTAYLEILAGAVGKFSRKTERKLVVYFPTASRKLISGSL